MWSQKKRDETLSMSLAKKFSESNGEIQYFMEHIRRVYIPSCTQRSNIYIIFVIWLSCRNGKLKKIWQFSYHEKCVWLLWLGLTIRVTHRIYWPKSNVKFIMHALWNVFRKKWTKLNWMNKPYHCITVLKHISLQCYHH